MDKTELVNDMKRTYKSAFITRQQLAQYMGKKDPHGIDKYLRGLERVDKSSFFIPDVARAIKERSYI